jgi:hypothetical protein
MRNARTVCRTRCSVLHGAPQGRDPHFFSSAMGPGSASRHFVPRRVWDTGIAAGNGVYGLRRAAKPPKWAQSLHVSRSP